MFKPDQLAAARQMIQAAYNRHSLTDPCEAAEQAAGYLADLNPDVAYTECSDAALDLAYEMEPAR